MGWDLRTGLDAATGATIVVIDGDAQNPLEDVLRMYRLMREPGADVGKGVRTNRADGLYRRRDLRRLQPPVHAPVPHVGPVGHQRQAEGPDARAPTSR